MSPFSSTRPHVVLNDLVLSSPFLRAPVASTHLKSRFNFPSSFYLAYQEYMSFSTPLSWKITCLNCRAFPSLGFTPVFYSQLPLWPLSCPWSSHTGASRNQHHAQLFFSTHADSCHHGTCYRSIKQQVSWNNIRSYLPRPVHFPNSMLKWPLFSILISVANIYPTPRGSPSDTQISSTLAISHISWKLLHIPVFRLNCTAIPESSFTTNIWRACCQVLNCSWPHVATAIVTSLVHLIITMNLICSHGLQVILCIWIFPWKLAS